MICKILNQYQICQLERARKYFEEGAKMCQNLWVPKAQLFKAVRGHDSMESFAKLHLNIQVEVLSGTAFKVIYF